MGESIEIQILAILKGILKRDLIHCDIDYFNFLYEGFCFAIRRKLRNPTRGNILMGFKKGFNLLWNRFVFFFLIVFVLLLGAPCYQKIKKYK